MSSHEYRSFVLRAKRRLRKGSSAAKPSARVHVARAVEPTSIDTLPPGWHLPTASFSSLYRPARRSRV